MISVHQPVRESMPKDGILDQQGELFAKSFNRFTTSPLGSVAQATTALYCRCIISHSCVIDSFVRMVRQLASLTAFWSISCWLVGVTCQLFHWLILIVIWSFWSRQSCRSRFQIVRSGDVARSLDTAKAAPITFGGTACFVLRNCLISFVILDFYHRQFWIIVRNYESNGD